MFDKQVRFRVGEFDGEKECAAGNEVSGGRLKALASTKLKVETANRQSNNRVRAYRTHPTRWF